MDDGLGSEAAAKRPQKPRRKLTTLKAAIPITLELQRVAQQPNTTHQQQQRWL